MRFVHDVLNALGTNYIDLLMLGWVSNSWDDYSNLEKDKIVRSHNDVISHVFGDKDLYFIQDKIYKLLTALDAKSYVLISSGQATEFTETAKEIKDITLMAQEDRVNILILFYVENGKEVTTEFTIINRDSVDEDKTELEWKKDSIEIIHNIIIKRW